MSSDFAIRIKGVSKCFLTYRRPQDRLLQSLALLLARRLPPGSLRAGLEARAQSWAKPYWALQGIDLTLRRGETCGIIGRNGSGKSTLLQILCGTLNPSAGEVEVNGRVAALLELGSGFNPEYSGRENVYLNGQLLGLTKPEIDARLDAIIAFADIGDFIEQPVKTYSSGMFVRLAFAVIAHVDADILVIDEALAVGDTFFTQKCMRFMRSFMETGTILFVSHDTGAVKSLCKKAVWLERGQIQQTGSAKEVSESYLEAFYESQQGKSTTTKMRGRGQGVDGQADASGQTVGGGGESESLALSDGLSQSGGGLSDAASGAVSNTVPAPAADGQSTPAAPRPPKDARLAWLNRTPLRNDIQVFAFDEKSAAFGTGDAEIVAVDLLDGDGAGLAWVVGGEEVTLKIAALSHRPIFSPILGFFIKDRLGQVLFGDNTYLTYHDKPLEIGTGQYFEARFRFAMPVLPMGDYSVCVAVAEGTATDHVQLNWLHDARLLRSESSSVSTGLVGIPMHTVEIRVER